MTEPLRSGHVIKVVCLIVSSWMCTSWYNLFWVHCCLCCPWFRCLLKIELLRRSCLQAHNLKSHKTQLALACLSASEIDRGVAESAAGCRLLVLCDLKLNLCLSLLAAFLNLLRACFEVLVPAPFCSAESCWLAALEVKLALSLLPAISGCFAGAGRS